MVKAVMMASFFIGCVTIITLIGPSVVKEELLL
jgi:hypothetical protein